jgi:hypothetical protein
MTTFASDEIGCEDEVGKAVVTIPLHDLAHPRVVLVILRKQGEKEACVQEDQSSGSP